MDFGPSNILIPLSASFIVFILKENLSLINSEAVVIMLGCFLYLQ